MADHHLDGRAARRSGHQPALDRRQVLRAMLLGAAGLAVPAACGLPSGGHAIIDGPAKTTQPGSADNPPKAPIPDDATSPSNLVTGFFGAVAGRNADDLNSANDRALKFLTSNAKSTWPQQGNGITVVSLLPDTLKPTIVNAFKTTVDVSVKPTGSLGVDGTVLPPTQIDASRRMLRFTVVQGTDPKRPAGYLIDQIQTLDNAQPLTGMMLDSSLLDGDLYTPQLIYFWSTDRSGLVPDLRYVARAGVGRELQYTDVVNWMLHGPSDFLKDAAVQPNPYNGNSLALPNLAAPDNDGLLINLNLPTPQSLSKDKVMAQLRWSLRQLYSGSVRLQVASQPQNVDGSAASTGFRRFNLADQVQERDDTVYCIAGGVVRPLVDPTNIPPILGDENVNKEVVLAALRPDLKAAALVKADGHLYLGEAAQGPGKFSATTLAGKAGSTDVWTRPVYLPSNNNRILIGLNGLLYLVGADGQAVQVHTPDPIQTVSAFSLAPDGRRIAVISGGVPFVCSVKVNGDDISLGGSPRQIDAGLSPCTGIAWIRLDKVVIAGRLGGGYQIVESTIDGAIQNNFGSAFSTEIRSIVALPPIAWNPNGGPEVALVQTAASGDAGHKVYASISGYNSPIGFTTTTTPSPSPSASGAAQGAVLGTPTYPFYLG